MRPNDRRARGAEWNYAALTTRSSWQTEAASRGSYLPEFGAFRPSSWQRKKGRDARMLELAIKTQQVEPPESAVLDRAHLARMTFNDSGLEREILQLFERQAELLLNRMGRSEPPAIATLAHTLKGSAVGVGAGRVARAAAATEAAARSTPRECIEAMDQLARAVDEVRIEIAGLLRTG
jgi:HPt (histidine-containing phosphotransfer) domain-containing protein